ncbi:vWA domain-containing protein [Aurantiacibacter gilvus]|uniref:VWA domain-containing protein n=1 Tax=Aurantiacibacter gilvus TaxID=3139141 RepID=A0ABU9IE79_9SPHN
MRLKKFVALACSVAVLAPIPTVAAGPQEQAHDRRHAPLPVREYCRLPEPLPQLGPERAWQGQQQQPRVASSRAMAEPEMAAPPPPAPPPPPPPPPSAPVPGSASSDAVVVTGTRVARSDYESASPVATVGSESAPVRTSPAIMPPPGRRPQPRPQSGLLTAGEHDDLLNPELYARYVHRSNVGQAAQGVPVLDTSRLLTVELRDNRGRAMPFETVELRCADGNTIELRTVADGTVVFFPELDRLSDRVWVRAGGGDWREVVLSQEAGGQDVRITSRRSAQAVTKLDLNLVIDVTGSMSDELRFLQAELTSIIDQLSARHRGLDIRIGFTFYRDQTDAFVTNTHGFDRARGRMLDVLNQYSAGGGGDYEEAMQEALIRAAGQDWRPDAVKTLLLVADAPPHDQDIALTWRAAEHLRAERVHIVPVGASGVADKAEYIMRAMAAATQSRYTFLTDDSGIGNAHAEPDVDCYLVTRLDQLLRRVIDSQLSGRRIEPEDREVIRSVGSYDAGRCVLPANWDWRQQK